MFSPYRKISVIFGIILCLFSSAFAYSGGSGEPNDPYRIAAVSDWQQLMSEPNNWDKHFIMTADVNLQGIPLTPVGNSSKYFTGVFDGNGHIIRNVDINMPTSDYIGLFGCILYNTCQINNLGVVDVNITGRKYVGGLVGYIRYGRITDCYVAGAVKGDDFVGGLVGYNYFGRITACYATGVVAGNRWVGGLVGGNIERSMEVGIITACYAAGAVTGNSYVGGLVGLNSGSGRITYCFWDVETSGQTSSAGGTGKTTAEMKTLSTFVSWGCNGVWTIDNGNDYPRLIWEGLPGQLILTPTYGGGSGTADNPFLIYTPAQLNTIGLFPCHMNKHFKLMVDIDLSDYTGTQFNIIGNPGFPFTGAFDGNNKRILNFSYKAGRGSNGTGLFGSLSEAEIKNIGLIEPNVVALSSYCTGALIGVSTNSKIINCYVAGGVVKGIDTVGGLIGSSGSQFSPGDIGSQIEGCWTSCYVEGNDYSVSIASFAVGGLVGQNSSRIYNSYSTSIVRGTNNIGGLVGISDGGEIRRCFAEGDVAGDSGVGGLVGWNDYKGQIYDSYATGNVSATVESAGGLVGYATLGSFFRCYATGNVNCPRDVGGLIGGVDDYYNNKGYFYDCFWNQTVNPSMTGVSTMEPDPNGITGKTTAQMQTKSTFTNAGWDFFGETANGTEDIWTICQGVNYPKFVWQNQPPIAEAGPDQTAYAWIDGIAEVDLDGFGSSDPDCNELTYYWSWVIDGNTCGANPTIELPIGVHTIQLVVNDGLADSEPDYVGVNVIAPLKADLSIVPSVVNRSSHLQNIMTVMELPKGIKRTDVSSEPFVLYPADSEEGIEAVRQYVCLWRHRVRVIALFSKDELMDIVPDSGRVKLQVVGQLNSGQYVFGDDSIRIIGRHPFWWRWRWHR